MAEGMKEEGEKKEVSLYGYVIYIDNWSQIGRQKAHSVTTTSIIADVRSVPSNYRSVVRLLT